MICTSMQTLIDRRAMQTRPLIEHGKKGRYIRLHIYHVIYERFCFCLMSVCRCERKVFAANYMVFATIPVIFVFVEIKKSYDAPSLNEHLFQTRMHWRNGFFSCGLIYFGEIRRYLWARDEIDANEAGEGKNLTKRLRRYYVFYMVKIA